MLKWDGWYHIWAVSWDRMVPRAFRPNGSQCAQPGFARRKPCLDGTLYTVPGRHCTNPLQNDPSSAQSSAVSAGQFGTLLHFVWVGFMRGGRRREAEPRTFRFLQARGNNVCILGTMEAVFGRYGSKNADIAIRACRIAS